MGNRSCVKLMVAPDGTPSARKRSREARMVGRSTHGDAQSRFVTSAGSVEEIAERVEPLARRCDADNRVPLASRPARGSSSRRARSPGRRRRDRAGPRMATAPRRAESRARGLSRRGLPSHLRPVDQMARVRETDLVPPAALSDDTGEVVVVRVGDEDVRDLLGPDADARQPRRHPRRPRDARPLRGEMRGPTPCRDHRTRGR